MRVDKVTITAKVTITITDEEWEVIARLIENANKVALPAEQMRIAETLEEELIDIEHAISSERADF